MYSAPFALVGKALWLRANDGCVALYEGYVLVATHPRGQRKGQRVTTPDHLPPQAQWFFARDRQWLDEQASEVGPHCQQVIDWLLSDKIVERLRAAQGVIGLAKTYGRSRLEAACHRAKATGPITAPVPAMAKSLGQSLVWIPASFAAGRFKTQATTAAPA
jgi:hypothetical protein